MKVFRLAVVAWALFSNLLAPAKEVTDTLSSGFGDRVIVTYEVNRKESGATELRFIRAVKMLGRQHSKDYKSTKDMVVVFFDRIGVMEGISFEGLTPTSFRVPSNVTYTGSQDGYFIIEHQPAPMLSFNVASGDDLELSIPLYLAYHKRKQHYRIIASLGNLNIAARAKAVAKGRGAQPPTAASPTTSPKTQFVEIGGSLPENDFKALKLINSIMEGLPNQTALPIDRSLQRKVDNLTDLQSEVENPEIADRIEQVLTAFEDKNKELEQKQRQEEEAKQREAERKIENDAANQCLTIEACEIFLATYPNSERAEEIRAKKADLEQQAQAEANKKKNKKIWTIIGGIFLAILLFVGNQAMQSFRNMRTQRSMMQMQQDVANRAKSKARGVVRQQTSKAVNQVRRKGQEAVRTAVGKGTNSIKNVGKSTKVNKKRVSI